MDSAEGLTPELVEETDFPTVRRGYEPEQVRSRLREAAAEIRRLNTVVNELSRRVGEYEAAPPEQLEASRVAEAFGDEAARLLQAARDAAQERIERADAECEEIVGKAHAAATAIVEEGRDHGREVVQEARSVRERILADLARKRRMHRAEVEQLRTVRDRLLESLSICQQGLRDWIEELVQVVPQARAAAERAGLRIAAEPEPTVSQMEAEIETGRLMGLPLDEQPAEPEPQGDVHADEWAAVESGGAWDEAETFDADETGLDEFAVTAESEDGPEPELASAPASSAPVGPYDVEAEPDGRYDDGPVPPPEPASEAAEPAAPPLEKAAEPAAPPLEKAAASAAGGGPASDAGAIFARLRAVGQELGTAVAEPASPPDPEVPDDPDEPAAAAEPPAPSDAAAEPPAPSDPAIAAESAPEPSDPDDLLGAARAVAVSEIARRLKRMVVDEHGELLDALRRIGVRALEARIGADSRPYARVVRGPLEDFASDIDVSIDDIDLKAAGSAVISVLVDPVRARLKEFASESDDVDELSAAVRAVYRESRSRRADAAAEEAFAVGWPEPVA